MAIPMIVSPVIPTWDYTAKVVRVIDGDTIDLLADCGFSIFHQIRVRVYGIQCPELRSSNEKERILAEQAKRYAEQLLPEGSVIAIRSHKERMEDRYGRYLVEIVDVDGTWSFGQAMLNAGLAKSWFGTGPKPTWD